MAKSVLPILQQLVTDPIPNIRFNVAKSYAVLIDILKRLPDDPNATIAELENQGSTNFPGSERGSQIIRDEIMPPLEKLMQDDDVDVRYFAMTASKAWTDTENAMET